LRPFANESFHDRWLAFDGLEESFVISTFQRQVSVHSSHSDSQANEFLLASAVSGVLRHQRR
jgi:hypothetical protein